MAKVDPRLRKRIYLFSIASKPAVGPNKSPIERELGAAIPE
jgi:hypothetical protein